MLFASRVPSRKGGHVVLYDQPHQNKKNTKTKTSRMIHARNLVLVIAVLVHALCAHPAPHQLGGVVQAGGGGGCIAPIAIFSVWSVNTAVTPYGPTAVMPYDSPCRMVYSS